MNFVFPTRAQRTFVPRKETEKVVDACCLLGVDALEGLDHDQRVTADAL
jgi:hypothetical protein